MPRKLVVLSTAAIAAVYAAGYGLTHDAAAQLEAGDVPVAITAAAAPSSAAAGAAAPFAIAPTAAPTAPSASTLASTAASQYRDGTYQGTGGGRFGTVTVSVTVAGGRITDVELTKVATTYPATQIAGLPAQVVARQSANVDRVTGATASIQAFTQAVRQALSQASAATAQS